MSHSPAGVRHVCVEDNEVTEDEEFLAERFEADRAHLRAVAYRMLGSLSEADDAVQEAWLRLSGSDTRKVENLTGWLTTVVGRVCLDMLRTRRSRREDPLDVYVPDPIVSGTEGADPEHEALLADSVGLALLVVLEALPPAERLAFVLHDMFGMPFDEIAPIVDRTPAAARQLASRGRRRVRGTGSEPATAPESDPARGREVVDAFLAASRGGDFEGLLALLDPDVVLRVDVGGPTGDAPAGDAAGVGAPAAGAWASKVVRGARAVSEQALTFRRLAQVTRPVLVNGAPGLVAVDAQQRPLSLAAFVVRDGKITEIDILADPARLSRLDLTGLGTTGPGTTGLGTVT